MLNQIYLLFLCPACNKYTIHMPRLTQDGRWMVDHKLVWERLFGSLSWVSIPVDYCEVNAVQLARNRKSFTRTVIRV